MQHDENKRKTGISAADDIDVDELMSGGYLSGAQYDAIADRVVLRTQATPTQQSESEQQSSPEQRLRPVQRLGPAQRLGPVQRLGSAQWLGRAQWLSLAALLAGATGLYFLSTHTVDDAVGFRSKGVSSLNPIASVELACGERVSRGGTLRCPLGATLMFTTRNASSSGYLAAFAVPNDSGPRIWYFPTSAGDLPAIPAAEGTSVVDHGVVLGGPHQTGSYRVSVHLLTERMTRDAIGALPDDTTTTFELEIE